MVSYNDYFSGVKLSELPPPPIGRVVTISSEASVAEACSILHEAHILSAPVVDGNARPSDHWTKKYVGMVDMMQIVLFTVNQSERLNAPYGSFLKTIKESPVFSTTKVSAIVASSSTSNMVPLMSDSSVLDALLVLGKFRVHRIPVVDSSSGDIINIISQSSAVRMMAEILLSDRLVNLRSELCDLDICYKKEVVSVIDSNPLLSAFDTLIKEGISAVPVLDSKNGCLIACISASDIHFVVSQPSLYCAATVDDLPIRAFLNWHVDNRARQKHPVTVHPSNSFIGKSDDTGSPTIDAEKNPIKVKNAETIEGASTVEVGRARMEDVVKSIVNHNVHRIYVTADGSTAMGHEGKLLGVISLCDVISAVTLEPPDYFGDFCCASNSPGYR